MSCRGCGGCCWGVSPYCDTPAGEPVTLPVSLAVLLRGLFYARRDCELSSFVVAVRWHLG